MAKSNNQNEEDGELEKTLDYGREGEVSPLIAEALRKIDQRLHRIEISQQNEIENSPPRGGCRTKARATQSWRPTFGNRTSNAPNQTRYQAPTQPHQAANYQPHQAEVYPFGPDEYATAEVPAFHEVQEQFNAVKQTVEKVILPTHLKLHESRSGIKKEDQSTLNVISKCGRYVETILKLLSQATEEEPVDIEPIYTCLYANIKYLQEEYSALLVKGKFDDSTAHLFRALQKGNSGFDASCLQNVRVAAELSSISNRYIPQAPHATRGRGNRGYSYNRGFQRGRGYNRDYRREDVFSSFTSKPRFPSKPSTENTEYD